MYSSFEMKVQSTRAKCVTDILKTSFAFKLPPSHRFLANVEEKNDK